MNSQLDHKVTSEILKRVFSPPDPDSHKGQNGKLLIISDSPLFHGAGILSYKAAMQVVSKFGSRVNDMIYVCSTKENLDYLKKRQETFIGIKREQLDNYLKVADVVLIGPGLMREPDDGNVETEKEPLFTKESTLKVLQSGKKAVLDSGSLQVINKNSLKGRKNLIITPHRKEMAKLFKVDEKHLVTSHNMSERELEKVASMVWKVAQEFQITILLKGPIDIIANESEWNYSPGGNAGMTKGGTGDVLAGVVAALYTKSDNSLQVGAAASFILKKAGESLWNKKKWVFDASDLVDELTYIYVNQLNNEYLKKD